MAQKTLILFGGDSAEHEVSIITGLQIVEKIDRNQFDPYVVYLGRDNVFRYYPHMQSRKEFLNTKPQTVTLGKDENGAFIQSTGMLSRKIYIDLAYLAFHGGNGESGPVQGMMEVLGIAYTSPNQEASVITMNKALTKQVLQDVGVPTIPGTSFSLHQNSDLASFTKIAEEKVGLPAIVKPAHLGSSIGISVAKSAIELEKSLSVAAHTDSEVVVEKFLTGFIEYNCAVKLINGQVIASEIERPMGKDEILSFADKYQRGGKKTGAGMASLGRELPAQIAPELRTQIQDLARKAFIACRATGMVRIDFMYTADKQVYLNEINPIPGSMAFYLWEATGIPFTQQITELLNQAKVEKSQRESRRLTYKTDIVEKFVNN